MTDKKPLPKFTPEEKKIINDAGHAVWNEIGFDIMQALQEDAAERGRRKDSIPRSHVIELVCDAGRLEEKIKDQALKDKVYAASSRQLSMILRTAFPYASYGL